MKRDGEFVRRVVPSPKPLNIIDKKSIETLLGAGEIVICCGGGGIPVRKTDYGYTGVEG